MHRKENKEGDQTEKKSKFIIAKFIVENQKTVCEIIDIQVGEYVLIEMLSHYQAPKLYAVYKE
jgi:hypothetical protein